MNIKKYILLLIICSNVVFAVSIRPQVGYGIDDSKHLGLRILLKSSPSMEQAYGLEITQFKTTNDEFTAIGIILEQRQFGWFNNSIGTIGYLNYGEDNQNIFGLVTNLGFEPKTNNFFKPFISFRTDLIFTKSINHIYSLSIGYKFNF